MSSETNTTLFLRYQDALRDPNALDELLTDDFVAYDLPESFQDREGLKRFRRQVNSMAPDQTITVDYLVAEGDLVAAHMTAMQTLPGGERVSFCLMELDQVRDGRIAWRRVMLDAKGMELMRRARPSPA